MSSSNRRSAQARRQGRCRQGTGLALYLVCLFLLVMGSLAFVTSRRGGDVHRQAAITFAGRQAEELACSAIDLALSALTAKQLLAADALDAQGQFTAAFLGRLSSSELDLTNPDVIAFDAARAPYDFDPVTSGQPANLVAGLPHVRVKPLVYSSLNNVGMLRAIAGVELDAHTLPEERVGRSVTEERQFAIDPRTSTMLRIERTWTGFYVERKVEKGT